MVIEDLHIFAPVNIYSLKEHVIRIKVRIGELNDIPTKDINNLNEQIMKFFPGLYNHKCSKGYEGGFVERLKEGTYIAHVAEHLCLELQRVLGHDQRFGKTRQVKDDVYNIVYSCRYPEVGKACGLFIIRMLNSIIERSKFDFDKEFETIKRLSIKRSFGPSTQAIIDKAKERGIPVSEIEDSGILRLGYGKYQKMISATLFENTSCISVDISCEKNLTRKILKDSNIPVPEGRKCLTFEDALEAASKIGFPVVVKPNKGCKGKNVFVNVSNKDELLPAFNEAASLDGEVVVEEYITGNDYRFLVVNGKFAAASQRIPAMVTGDGIHTVKELIDIVNNDELRGEDHEKPLTRIKEDENTQILLSRQGLSMDSVPEKGMEVMLKKTANLSSGGMAVDCTDIVHPYNRQIAEEAVKTIGLDIGGVDIVTKDITRPLGDGNGAVIEVNAAPGIRMHLFPSKGKKQDVASPILDMIFPDGQPSSIPIVAVTGTNGKTTTTRMISHIMQLDGFTTGVTTTHGILINGKYIEKGDTTGPASARRVLNNKSIDAAVLETARGGIVREGLGYERADVAVFTNLTGDHLGIDGINTMEDLLNVKSLVVEAVKADGASVLNADDEWVMKSVDKAKGEKILFSADSNNSVLKKHINNGGRALFMSGGFIAASKGGVISNFIGINEIPSAMDGILKHNVYNAMAAACACIGAGIPEETIKKGLRTFVCDTEMNPGRFNMFEIGDINVVLDYGHNPDGIAITAEALKKIGHERLVGVIGVPGDRRDDDIRRVGEIAGGAFDKIIIKEDADLRGRKPFEVAIILEHAALDAGISKDRVEIIPNEEEALKNAIENAASGDLIVMFFEKLEPLVEIVKRYQRRA
ncbi:MAG TPA: cyanophycin synthetase, partial [Clostridia bacterium]